MTPLSYKIDFADTGTAQTNTVYITENGFCHNIVIDATNLPGTHTVAVAILDADSYDLLASGNITGGTTSTWGGFKAAQVGGLPLDYGYTVVATLSGALGGSGGHIHVKLYVDNSRGH